MNILIAQSCVLKSVLQKGFILSYQKLKTALTSCLEQERDHFERFAHRQRAEGEFVPEQAASTYRKSLNHEWDMYELREDAEEAWWRR